MRILLAATVAVALVTPALAQTLSGNQIRQQLVGRTVNGTENGEAYSEYLNPNGTISGKSASGEYSGRWRISGDEICFLYPEEGNSWDCNEVRLNGAQITWDNGATATLSGGAPVSYPRARRAAPASTPQPVPAEYAEPAAPAPAEYGAPAPIAPPAYYPAPAAAVPCAPPRGLFGGFGNWGCNCSCY